MFGTPLFFCCLLPIALVLLGVWYLGVVLLAKQRAPAWAIGIACVLPWLLLGCLFLPYLVLTEGTISAAGDGDVAGLKWRLAMGADPNVANVDGASPLASAVSFGHVDAARLLLERGANPDARYPDEDENFRPSARQEAVERNDRAMLNLLSKYPRKK